jgi:hypothetical protein
MTQLEIIEKATLLDQAGKLNHAGWARQPLLDCNLENANVFRPRAWQRFRIKQWDYYGVTYPGGFFSATIADLGYAGQVFVYTVDFDSRSYVEDTITIPLARGVILPRNSEAGISEWVGKNARLRFAAQETGRQVRVEWADFGGKRLQADLRFTLQPDHESTVVVIPIAGHRFYYNRKVNCMPVSGTISLGDHTMPIASDSSSGTLDWGRGSWEYNSFWVWASGSGFLNDGRRVGLNMGFGFGDTSAATENTVFVDGRIHKLAELDFDYDSTDFMRPWKMRSDRADLEFTPLLERTAKTNLLLIRSEVHQMFGHYRGTVVDDHGDRLRIEDVPGWAEEHRARW